VISKAQEGLMAKPLPGTELDKELYQRAADAIGLSFVPAPNAFRVRDAESKKVREEAEARSGKTLSVQ
jgi:hypothetical protein